MRRRSQSYREYDQVFRTLEEHDSPSLEKLLALPDQERWERERCTYPLIDGKHTLAQPSLPFEDTWKERADHGQFEEKMARFEELVEQARVCQQQVKNKLLRACVPLSATEMEERWPQRDYIRNPSELAPWGGGDAYDPGVKSGGRMRVVGDSKYGGNYALLKDVSRFALYYTDAHTLMHALRALDAAFKIVRVENRFRRPTVLGWRDVTLLIEETIVGGEYDGARHLAEVQLQLSDYAAARKKAVRAAPRSSRTDLRAAANTLTLRTNRTLPCNPQELCCCLPSAFTGRGWCAQHHYYEVLREKVVHEVKVDASEQDGLLVMLLDAIVGEQSRVSGKLLEHNHRVLQDVHGVCFGELWAQVTCLRRQPPSAIERFFDRPYTLSADLVDHDDLILENDAVATTRPGARAMHMHTKPEGELAASRKPTREEKRQQRDLEQVQRNLDRAVKIIEHAAEHNDAIRLVVDSCLRKLGVGTDGFESMSGTTLREAAVAVIGSEPVRQQRPAAAQHENEVLLGRCRLALSLNTRTHLASRCIAVPHTIRSLPRVSLLRISCRFVSQLARQLAPR
jgi:hypothetical protein